MYVHGKNPCDGVKFEVYFVAIVVIVVNKIVKPKHKSAELF